MKYIKYLKKSKSEDKEEIKFTSSLRAKSNTRRRTRERRGAQRVGFLGRILLAGRRSGPAHRKLVRAASDCEDNRTVLYAGPGADGIGWYRMVPSDTAG